MRLLEEATMEQNGYAAVSLFSGCGGMDLGAEQTGAVKVVCAVDNDRWAVETYRENLGNHAIRADVTTMEVPSLPCDILLAGPPCQDFSTLWNHDGYNTSRGNLFREVARFLHVLRPAAFVLENVMGLLSANNGAAWTAVRHALRAPSRAVLNPGDTAEAYVRYEILARVVDVADLGVPQHRRRVFVIGVRRDLRIRPPEIPLPFRGRHVTVHDALDLIPLGPLSFNHEIGLDSPDVVSRLAMIPPGKNYQAIPEGHRLAVRGLINHVYKRLDPNMPAYTIIANGGGGTHGYHHREPRRLSNREKARLQSFPDNFRFSGGLVQKIAYTHIRRQVGNAVPPQAAKVILGALVNTLRKAGVATRTSVVIESARREATTWSSDQSSLSAGLR